MLHGLSDDAATHVSELTQEKVKSIMWEHVMPKIEEFFFLDDI